MKTNSSKRKHISERRFWEVSADLPSGDMIVVFVEGDDEHEALERALLKRRRWSWIIKGSITVEEVSAWRVYELGLEPRLVTDRDIAQIPWVHQEKWHTEVTL